MYHHFGGKADLFLALHDGYQARQEERADAAVREVLMAGERNSVRLFAAGARAFMQGAWEERDLARLFFTGDGPPGFDTVSRAGFGDWVRRSETVLRGPDDGPLNQAYPLLLATVIAAGTHEVTQQTDERAAMAFMDDILVLLTRFTAAPPP